MGGIASAFQFVSYKVDILSLDVTKDTKSLLFNGVLVPDQLELSVNIRNPLHIISDNAYVGGLDVALSIYFSSDHAEGNRIAQGRAGVSGYFKVVEGPLAPELEANLVRVQIPAVLFPFFRSALSSLTINAGFPGVILPLINVQELAKQAGDKIQIQEVAPPTPAPAPPTN
ncbi:MAG: protein-export chaperone SecB [Spirochaetia bacterium]|jgi:preprotein translocase subunit SecB